MTHHPHPNLGRAGFSPPDLHAKGNQMSAITVMQKLRIPKIVFWVFLAFCLLQTWIHYLTAYRTFPSAIAVFESLTSPVARHMGFLDYVYASTPIAFIACILLLLTLAVRSLWSIPIAIVIGGYDLWFAAYHPVSFRKGWANFWQQGDWTLIWMAIPFLVLPVVLWFLGEIAPSSGQQSAK